MDRLDKLYRAIKDYRKNTTEDMELTNFRSSIVACNAENDLLKNVRYVCEIDEEWVDRIDEGLAFVEKALGEERQFIRSNGEVIPIEKVKHVSKESVEHLAKHSNLITHEPEEGNDLVPDRLFSVERLSDYTVYENRFLYMLLVYLKDFVSYRYDKIIDLTYTYNGWLELNKNVLFLGQNIEFEVKLHEVKKRDKYLREVNPIVAVIDKIEKILSDINFYLGLPLMTEVAKAPMVKPPIVKTNVLRMNKNFKGAVALYDYVTAYEKPGYSLREEVTTQKPFNNALADEISEILIESSFLAYKYNFNLENRLKQSYENEEERRRLQERKRLADKIKSLKRRVAEGEVSVEEYAVALEERIRDLELATNEMEALSEQLAAAKEENARQASEIREKNATIEQLHDEAEQAQLAHEAEIEKLNASWNEKVSALKSQFAESMQSLRTQHEEELAACQKQIEDTKKQCNDSIAAFRAECEKTVAAANADRDTAKNNLAAQLRVNEELEQSRALAEGKLNALRSKDGIMDDAENFTDEKAFNELEKEFEAFKKYFTLTWKKTKKRMKKETVTFANVKEAAKNSKKKGKEKEEALKESAAPVGEVPVAETKPAETAKTVESKPAAKPAETKATADVKSEAKPEVKAQPTAAAKIEKKPAEAVKPAETATKPTAKAEAAKPAEAKPTTEQLKAATVKSETKPAAKAEKSTATAAKPTAKAEAKPTEAKPAAKAEAKPAAKPATEPTAKQTNPETKSEKPSDGNK